jgi:mono/diheme cytochrome c family protein
LRFDATSGDNPRTNLSGVDHMRTSNAVAFTSLIGAVVFAFVAACSGSDGADGAAGAAGAAGAPGTVGLSGEAGTPGSGADGGSSADASPFLLALSERAQRGLAIAPVPLALNGKTAAQIEQIGIGSYLVNAAAACGECHTPGPGKYLAGGVVIPLDATNFVVTRNLTPDPTTGLKDTEAQYIQAERTGTDVLNVGKALLVHPWQYERWLSTADLKAIYAFLRVIPAVNNPYPADVKPTVPGLPIPTSYNEGDVVRTLPPEVDATGQPVPDPDDVLRGLAIVPLDVPPPTNPTDLALYGRGSYLVNAIGACASCHTNPERQQNATQSLTTAKLLTGGRVFPSGPAASLVKVQRSMSANLIGKLNGFFNQPGVDFQVFLQTITQGVHGDEIAGGTPAPLAFPMPYTTYRRMTLGDLQAVYTYMHHLATTANLAGPGVDKVTQEAARYCAATADCKGAGETCDVTAHECVGRVCGGPEDCDVCQKCTANACVAYTAAEGAQLGACIFTGL